MAKQQRCSNGLKTPPTGSGTSTDGNQGMLTDRDWSEVTSLVERRGEQSDQGCCCGKLVLQGDVVWGKLPCPQKRRELPATRFS